MPGFRIAPRFFAEDSQASTIGALADLDKPGLVHKPQNGWTSIYSAAPIVSALVLRQFAQTAGCHIYDDAGDVVVANASFLSIYSPYGGDRTIRLPKKSTVTDLLENKVIVERVAEFPLKLGANESVLFKIDEAAKPEGEAQAGNKARFRSFHAEKDVEPTADPDSQFWKGISGVIIDKSVLGTEMPKLRAEVRSRWTDKYIYFLFAGHYDLLTLNANPDLVKETPHLWEKDVFELYIGSDSEHTNRYRELQISPQGEFLDNDIDSTVRRPGYNGEEAWNSGMEVKTRIDHKNKIWYGEMKIPFAAVDIRQPQAGNELRVNMFRQDNLPRPADEHPRAFLAWQPPGVWNPHHPEKFGVLRLVDEQ